MSRSRTCPACGAEMPPGVEHCTRCLIELALETVPGRSAETKGNSAHRFGDYEIALDSPCLEGGMGIVYRARQVSLRRTVALKMVRGGVLLRPEQTLRFRAEAEAAASLDHPNIVPMYEIGEYDGRQYFAMKWLEGGSLADTLRARANQHEPGSADLQPPKSKRRKEPTRNGYTPPEAAALVSTVARAIHHAHQRGIIHRDLKPSNILLDARRQPHVSDFGLAKRSDADAALTLSGDTLGTPSYMAPEQAAGDSRAVTTAADIYSLGAILYELLTGGPPFVARTPAAIMQKVLTEEPKRPSAVVAGLPRDLETICLKCLEKEPSRRYGSAEALADDLDRWLRGESILAQPSGIWSRTQKWARRRPAVAALSGAVALSILLGFCASLIQLRRAERANLQAVENLAIAHRVVQNLIDTVSDARLREPDFDDLRNQILTTVIPFLEGFVKQSPGDETFHVQRATACTDLAGLLRDLGQFDRAETNFLMAIATRSRLVADKPGEPSYRRDLADAYTKFGASLSDGKRQAEAVSAHDAALKILKKLADEQPSEAIYLRDLSRVYQAMGASLARNGDGKKSVEAFLTAIQIGTSLATNFPATAESRYQLGMAYVNLGNVVGNDPYGRSECERYWNEALAIFDKLTSDFPAVVLYRHRLAVIHGRLSRLYADTDRWTEAEASFQKSRAMLERLASDYPLRPSFQHDLAEHFQHMGSRCARSGRTNEAFPLLEEAIAREKKLTLALPNIAKYRSSLADYYATLGEAHEQTNQLSQAEAAYSNSLAVVEKLGADLPDQPGFRGQLAFTERRLGELISRQPGRATDAEPHLKRSLALWEKLAADFQNNSSYQKNIVAVHAILQTLSSQPAPR